MVAMLDSRVLFQLFVFVATILDAIVFMFVIKVFVRVHVLTH